MVCLRRVGLPTEGGLHWEGSASKRGSASRGSAYRVVCISRIGLPREGGLPKGVCVGRGPHRWEGGCLHGVYIWELRRPQGTRKAGGTHPIGMISCFTL